MCSGDQINSLDVGEIKNIYGVFVQLCTSILRQQNNSRRSNIKSNRNRNKRPWLILRIFSILFDEPTIIGHLFGDIVRNDHTEVTKTSRIVHSLFSCEVEINKLGVFYHKCFGIISHDTNSSYEIYF